MCFCRGLEHHVLPAQSRVVFFFFLGIRHKGRSKKISLYNLGSQKATFMILKHQSVVLQILKKGTQFFSLQFSA